MDVTKALAYGWPGAQWSHAGERDDLTGITWHDTVIPRPTDAEIEQAWLDLKAQPPPPDPGDELDAALAEIQAGLVGITTVVGLKTAIGAMIDAMRGKAGRAGRIAGRPV